MAQFFAILFCERIVIAEKVSTDAIYFTMQYVSQTERAENAYVYGVYCLSAFTTHENTNKIYDNYIKKKIVAEFEKNK